MYKYPVNGQLSKQEPCWETWGGGGVVRLLGLLREKENAYLGSFLDSQDIRVLSLGTIWNFGKGTGLY
jgi:hypothetical protein